MKLERADQVCVGDVVEIYGNPTLDPDGNVLDRQIIGDIVECGAHVQIYLDPFGPICVPCDFQFELVDHAAQYKSSVQWATREVHPGKERITGP